MTGQVVDYYRLLSVSSTATTNEIKAAYRTFLLNHHPDKHSEHSSFDFDLLKTAYTTLTSPSQRAKYNASIARIAPTSSSHRRPAESISLESFVAQNDSFIYPCRCGNSFLLEPDDIEADRHTLPCSGCSEIVWVDYKVAEDSDYNE